jgi:sigma-B regulation protein RsbU (phosphoserine phosphatase)
MGALHTPRAQFHCSRACARLCAWALVIFATGLTTLRIEAQSSSAQSTDSPSNAAAKAVFDLGRDREPLVSLEGLWRFHPGDNPAWASPSFDDSTWPLLRGDTPWSDQGYAGMSGFGWYRFTVVLPAGHPPMALELAPVMTSYQIFFDGRLAGQVGSTAPSVAPIAVWGYSYFVLPPAPPGAAGPHTIHVALRVWHSHIWSSYLGGGPMAGGSLLGSASLLAEEQRHHDGRRRLLFVDLFSYSITALIVALTVFGLYAFRPQEREYLWFGLLLLAKALDAMLNIAKEVWAFPAVPVFDLLDGILVAGAQAALLLFLTKVLRLRRGFSWWVIMAMIAASSVTGALYAPGWLSVPVSALLQVFLLLPSAVWILFILAKGTIRREGTARLLFIPVLLVQGFWIVDNVIIALNQFGLPVEARILETPFVVAPFTMHPAVLAELLFVLGMLAFLIRRFTIGRRREERFERELEAARQVQQVLLPEEIVEVPGFAVECVYLPAEVIGGDFFQILPATDGGLLIVVGDVAGKGLPAALMVSVLVGAIRTEAEHTSDPARLLASLNERMYGRSQGKFTTCLCLHLSPQGVVTAANAGHLAPYRDGEEMPAEPALPLGILAPALYALSTFSLSPGQRLTIVSDGVLEAQSRDGELLGFERTSGLSTLPAAEIAAAARDFGQSDDITVVAVTFHGSPAVVPQQSIQVLAT